MVQNQVINYLLNTKDSSLIILNNLDKRYFSDYQNEWLFIDNHFKQYGNIPDKETFISHFPDFELVNVEESSNYLVSELFKDYQKKQLVKAFNRVAQNLNDGNLDKALDDFKESYDAVSKAGISLQCVDILKDTSRYNDYIERTKDHNKYFIKTGLKELDDIIGGWDKEEELATIIARPGVGKCLAKGTKVLMADGTFKKVEDIKIGDEVQSLNRTNKVLALHNGISKGYKITPKNGNPFIVSDNHILTLMHRKGDKAGKEELIDISIEDFINLRRPHSPKNTSTHWESNDTYFLYKPSIDYSTKGLRIDPYILGMWLGDGSSCRVELTNIDKELIEEWSNFAKKYNYKVSSYKDDKGKYTTFEITNGRKNSGRKSHNIIADNFKYYNLLNNKHIPLDYLTGDRNQRLELLAGILDTDGYLQKGKRVFNISQNNFNLIKQISQLARGLGFKVSNIKTSKTKYHYVYNYKDKHIDEIREASDQYSIQISGPTEIIPNRLERKKAISRTNNRIINPLITNFVIDRVEKVEYYGFMADGDHRYMLEDNTLTHNTWILIKFAKAAVEQGLNVGIYSGEMSEKKVGYRFDTLVQHVANGSLIHGNEDAKIDYTNYINDLPERFEGSLKVLTPSMINGPASVRVLRAFIEKENLDILFIDQHSLLEDDNHAKNPVERAANISKDLKNLQVTKKIPIIAVSQMNREKNDDSDLITLERISQADRIGQDSTCVIGIDRDKKDKSLIKLHLVKLRDNGEVGKILSYIVSFNLGKFMFVPEEEKQTEQKDTDLEHRYDVTEEDGEEF